MKRSAVIGVLFLFLLLIEGAEAGPRGREVGAGSQRPRLSALWQHTCAVLDDGTVRCWGANEQGQIGDGTVSTFKDLPTAPTNLFGAVAIAAGRDHTCALLLGGALGSSVRCWGDNEDGQLGNGTTTDSSSPVLVQNLQNATSIAAGDDHTCALISDGTVRCWGYNGVGNLGNGNTTNQTGPVQVQGLSDAIAITAGGGHTCALIVGGTVDCWGWNSFGQLGDGTAGFGIVRTSPGGVSGLTNAVGISAGVSHTCAVLVDGTARCWGVNNQGTLGDGTTANRSLPTAVLQLTNATAIAAGFEHTCALRSNGTVSCWGKNANAQLGDGTTANRLDAGTTVVGVGNIVEMVAGGTHACAFQANGVGRCWGSNALGQYGNDTTTSSTIPATVTGPFGSIGARGLAAGGGFNCARRGNGTAACWGSNSSGQLGNHSSGGSGGPAMVGSELSSGALNNVAMVTAGSQHACALLASGNIRCWGRNESGELGIGNTTSTNLAGNPVSGIDNAVFVAASGNHTCAVLVDGTARCWGSNNGGQLGTVGGIQTRPVQVDGLSGAVALATGNTHTCAVIVDGTIKCWGSGVEGQLGNPDVTTSSPTPVSVQGLTNIVAIAAGGNHTCALSVTGNVWCWGNNGFGQLGNSTTESRDLPDIVSGITDAVGLAAGSTHSCVVRVRAVASCWGRNAEGQLAAADTLNHLTPTLVIRSFSNVGNTTIANPLTSVTGIFTNRSFAGHTCALLTNGQPTCWGRNEANQVGDGSGVTRERPTNVPSFTANVDPTGSIRSNGRTAEITVLLNCEIGHQAQILISLTQGSTHGSAITVERCAGGLIPIPVKVPAHGPSGFQAGAATASLEAVIRSRGDITDRQIWTRAISLIVP